MQQCAQINDTATRQEWRGTGNQRRTKWIPNLFVGDTRFQTKAWWAYPAGIALCNVLRKAQNTGVKNHLLSVQLTGPQCTHYGPLLGNQRRLSGRSPAKETNWQVGVYSQVTHFAPSRSCWEFRFRHCEGYKGKGTTKCEKEGEKDQTEASSNADCRGNNNNRQHP